jgi:hypothetical protein
MSIGFVGTHHGMTTPQRVCVHALLCGLQSHSAFFHHGDCVGAEAEAHDLALELGYKVIIHPPTQNNLRAFCEGYYELRTPRPYLVRARFIVEESERLIATVYDGEERADTGRTIRLAWRRRKPVMIIYPDGRTDATQRSAFLHVHDGETPAPIHSIFRTPAVEAPAPRSR